jgi:dTDP-4-amino-4,6-dideoxygalactose transaminase
MGDGGFLVCPGKWHASKVSRLRWYGLSRESSTDMRCLQRVLDWGYKFNSNDIAAATGLANLPHLDGILDQYRANGQFYDEELYSRDSVIAQPADRYKDASYWLYTLLIENRSEFQRAMADAGIATSQVHSRTDTHQCVDAYKSMLPGVDYVDSRMVCIPSGWWITPEDRQYIVDTMKKGW